MNIRKAMTKKNPKIAIIKTGVNNMVSFSNHKHAFIIVYIINV